MRDERRERRQRRQAWLIAGLAVTIAGLAILPGARWRFILSPFENSRGEAGSGSPAAPAPVPHGDPDPARLLPVDATSAAIEAWNGGRIEGPASAAALVLPPHALPADERVEIARLTAPGPLAGGTTIDLRPDGLALRKPARLELPLPAGFAPDEVEVAVFDASKGGWFAESRQRFDPRAQRLVAEILHFSLRRVRVRPGMNYPYDPRRSGATFMLSDDLDQTYEKLVDGRWIAVGSRSREYSELVRAGRSARHALIAAGRLRAVVGPPGERRLVNDDRVTATLPRGVPEARTGWVRITLLDDRERPTAHAIVAQVVGETPPALIEAGLAVRLSRAAVEQLGLRWGVEFGLDPETPELGWIRWIPPGAASPSFRLPVRLEPADPPPP